MVIFLTDRDTVVVDPTRLQGQIQTPNPSENCPVGRLINLGGERGFVTVTALDAAGAVVPQLVGAWTIADVATGAGFGSDAVGVSWDGTLGDPAVLAGGHHAHDLQPAAARRLGRHPDRRRVRWVAGRPDRAGEEWS